MDTVAMTQRPTIVRVVVFLLGLSILLAGRDEIWALDNGLALTPPMGWMAWQRFTCQVDCASHPDDCINEQLFLAQAKRMVDDGYAALGYNYVSIDDCWSEHDRDASSGRLVANRTRFPAGIQKLADQMHAMNLKLGLYGDCGMQTCAGYPGQLKPSQDDTTAHMAANNHFQVDAETLVDWRLDSFKFDGCHIDPTKAEQVCPLMSAALNQSTPAGWRPILLICEWPFYLMYAHQEADLELAGHNCNVWRYYDDIEDSWQSVLNTIDYSVKHQSRIVKFHGPGHWFDPDQLVVGNFGLSLEQARAQMAIWALWSAPLLMGNDLRAVSPEAAAVLKNPQLIQVDQDGLGVFGLMVGETPDRLVQAFVKPVLPVRSKCPSFVVLYFSRATLGNRRKVSFNLRDLLLSAPIKQAQRNQLMSPAGRQDEPIDVRSCLQRLKKADSGVHYKLTDLIGHYVSELSLDQPLELLVAPSSVRIVKLVEADDH